MDILGIDFGTSNSLAAVMRNDSLKLVEFDGQKSAPTVLFFPAISLLKRSNRNYEFGRRAIEAKYEEDDIGRLIFSFKGLLADESFDGTVIPIYGTFTAEKFCSYFLKKVKETAENQFQTEFKAVVLGRPVEFDQLATNRLKNAAEMAGFEEIHFQLEPIAAAMSYERTLLDSDGIKTILVCDIGGGTSDYAILRLSKDHSLSNDRGADILATGGVYKAGESFNSQIVVEHLAERFGKGAKWGYKEHDFPIHWIRSLGNWKTLPFLRQDNVGSLVAHTEESRQQDVKRLADLVNHNWGYQLYTHVDASKIELSKQSETEINFRAIDLAEKLSRDQFENLISPILELMEFEIFNTLERANLKPVDIDKVILTGGSSLTPAVQEQVVNIFGESKIVPIDAFNSVVAGLALEAEKYAKQGK